MVLWGWQRLVVAALAGALGALAQAPFDAWPVLFVSFTVLVWLLDGSGGRRTTLNAALTGWAFGYGYFLAGLHWIGAAFLVERETFGWLMPFAVLLLPAGLALFTGLGAAVARALWSPGPWRIAALAFALGGADWLRGTVLTGFPWISFGQAFLGWLPLAQAASLVGLYGLSVVAVFVFASPAALAGGGRVRAAAPVLAGIALVALAAFGLWRLGVHQTEFREDVRLRVVQPNIDQRDKWRPELLNEVVAAYLDLSMRRGPGGGGLEEVTHLVWPETALPVLINEAPDVLAPIADMLPEGTSLLLGAARSEADGPDRRRFFNSLYVIDDQGGIVTRYDKVHLVPFGEYLPLQELLERIGLQQLTQVRGGFTPGLRRQTMSIPGTPPLSPLICYEIIFPGEVVEGGARPNWLLNVTNDAWFGRTSGPYQHLAQARMRAIEEGLPVIRAANTGVSAIIDASGRLISTIPLSDPGIIDSFLPKDLESTFYARYGGIPAAGLLGISLFASLIGRSRRGSMDV